jgi:hypothetical protein
MIQAPYIEKSRCDEIIADAAAKQAPLVLTRRGPSGWVVAKSRFRGVCEPDRHLLIECPPGAGACAWPKPVAGELLGVAFRRGHKKCLFSTVVVEGNALIGEATPGLVVRWPSELQELQRRVYQRACPPPGRRMKVQIRPVGTPPDEPPALSGVVEDLSAGGMRLRCEGQPDLELDQAVHLDLALGRRTAVVRVDATLRHRQAADEGSWALGFQFAGMEATREGQELLARIARTVTDFQRAAVRRRYPRLQRHLQSR